MRWGLYICLVVSSLCYDLLQNPVFELRKQCINQDETGFLLLLPTTIYTISGLVPSSLHYITILSWNEVNLLHSAAAAAGAFFFFLSISFGCTREIIKWEARFLVAKYIAPSESSFQYLRTWHWSREIEGVLSMTQSTGMFCIRPFFHQPRLPKLGPFVEMPWTRCNLVTGHNRIRSEPRWMSGECEEVDKWLRPQILINLFEVRSPQAMNLVNRNRVTVKRTITHVMGRKRKKPGLFFNSCRSHMYGCRREVFFFLRYLVRFDTQQRRSSRVRRWSKNDAPFPMWGQEGSSVCVQQPTVTWPGPG